MEFSELVKSEWFVIYGIPALICIARICDVTVGTLRIIFVSKGHKFIAPILGFIEISIWLVAITQVMQNLDRWQNYIAYALGFSIGNYLGIYIEGVLAMGVVVMRIITKRDSTELPDKLKELGYSVSVIDAQGNEGAIKIIFTIAKRSNINKIVPLINKYNPRAVYSIEDVRHVQDPNILKASLNIKMLDFNRR